MADSALADPFSGVFTRGAVGPLTDGRAWTQAMLDFEAGLARACAVAGLIPEEAAAAIGAACRVDEFDVSAIGAGAASGGNPAIPLVSALKQVVPSDVAGHVHKGATSQDVVDTAMMLIFKRSLEPILADAFRVEAALARLARKHRSTVMHGRTLLQQAVPVTFGLKAAGWLAGVSRARRQLQRTAADCLALQFGGAAGTLASLGADGVRVAEALGDELGLPAPALPWHTERTRVSSIAGALATLLGALGKAGRDVTLLAQNEVGEAAPASGGGSSAMPHKRNPVAAVAIVACAQRAAGLLATLNGAMLHEHERAAGSWHAEWEPWSDLLRLTGSACDWAADLFDGLQVDGERMRANLTGAGDLLMAESVVAALTRDGMSGGDARELVDGAVQRAVDSGESLRSELLSTSGFPLSEDALDEALDPASYLGAAKDFVDRALREYAKETDD